MSVSESRAEIHISPLPIRSDDAQPPFWELEELIVRGFTHEAALAIMAARRSGHYPAVQPPDMHATDTCAQQACDEPLTVLLAGR